jgi:hypothetical protein
VGERRECETATVLMDGRVLVIGGIQRPDSRYALTADLYDPAAGTFGSAGPTESPVAEYCGHVATLLNDGGVLITHDDGTAQLYSPAVGAFTRTGSLKTPRGGSTATVLRDGRVLIAGGFARALSNGGWEYAPLASAELYDPATGTFSPARSMAAVRDTPAAALLESGRVLVAGGPSAEVYNPATGRFTQTGSMNASRLCAVATPLPDGRVLVAGGYAPFYAGGPSVAQHLTSAEIYDPAAGKFTRTGSASGPPADLVALRDGRILALVGGEDGLAVEIYDSSAGVFTAVGMLPSSAELVDSRTCSGKQSFAVLHDGRVLFPGDPSVLYWP